MSRLIVIVFNRPEFISLQNELFNKFLHPNTEVIYVNDAINADTLQPIINATGRKSYRLPQNRHSIDNPSVCSADSIEWCIENLIIPFDGISCIFAADLFLIDTFDPIKYIQDYDLVARHQIRGHINYIWGHFIIFNVPKLPNLIEFKMTPGIVEEYAVDTGGMTYWYFKKYHPKIKYIDYSSEIKSELVRKYFENDPRDNGPEIFDNLFVHYRKASGYDGKPFNYNFLAALTTMVKDLLQ